MSQTIARVITTIFLLNSLLVTSGQSRLISIQNKRVNTPQEQVASPMLVPEINPYGSLIGLKDATGKDVLKPTTPRWHEGYAIAYQARNSKGVYGNRFVYVMGDQVSTRKLKVEDQRSTISRKVVTTDDKALEIARFITWDQKSSALKSYIIITNTSNQELGLKAIEIDIDKRVLSRLTQIDGPVPSPGEILPPPCPGRGSVSAPASVTALASVTAPTAVNCSVADDCPPCPCPVPYCEPEPGQARSFERDPLSPREVNLEDLIGPKLPRFKTPMLSLSWSGANLSPSALKPGEGILVHYQITIPQPRKLQ